MNPSVLTPLMLLLLAAAALTAAYSATRRHDEEVDKRVGLVAAPVQPVASSDWLVTRAKALDDTVRTAFAAGVGRRWGMTSGAIKLGAIALVAAIGVGLMLDAAFGLPAWLGLPLSLAMGYFVPRQILLREQARAEDAFSQSFPDAVDTVGRMLRAGIPISAAVRAIGDEGAPAVSRVFREVADQMKIGVRIEEALDQASLRLGLSDFRFFTVAIVLQHATGGNLVATLDILSNIIRRRRAVRLKAKASTAEIRVSAYVLGSLPLLIVGGMLLVQPGYLAPLFSDPRGQVILAIAVGGVILAAVSMRYLMRGVVANV